MDEHMVAEYCNRKINDVLSITLNVLFQCLVN